MAATTRENVEDLDIDGKLKLRFTKASFFISSNVRFAKSLGVEQSAQLYAYRMQLLKGKCDPAEKPSIFERNEGIKRRWALWNNLGKMKKDEAAEGYIRVITAICPDWENWDGFPAEVALSRLMSNSCF